MNNPLLNSQALPAYGDIRAEHVSPALDVLLDAARGALERAVDPLLNADYHTLSLLLDVPLEQLSRAWGAVAHLNEVADTPELRAAYNDNLPRVSEFHAALGADERLYARYKALDTNVQTKQSMSAAQQRAVHNALRDFVLSGAELQGADKQRFTDNQERQAALAQQYSEHVLDATDSYALDVDEARLAGVPTDVVQAARDAAQALGQSGCRLSLQLPCWMPAMQYADDRALRETLHRAYVTRASELGPAALDNSAQMVELLSLRQEEAQLLGHAHYAELSLRPKMASTPEVAERFMRDLAQRARASAERDLVQMQSYAREQLSLEALQPWDLAYVGEKIKQRDYAFSEQDLKPYFTEPRVLQGLFGLIERLLEVSIHADQASTWHDTVRFYRLERQLPGQAGAQVIGYFYLDLYARNGKRPGAWMNEVCSRWARPDALGRTQLPVANLVCNFAPPVAGRPALLTHDDVVTLFHEFGHGLHHLLTQVDELAVAGISGVEWDAVELPSQFMENFCWEWDVLSQMTAHVDTGQPLPRELFERMRAARNFHNGLQTLRQVEYALLDLRLHRGAPSSPAHIQASVNAVRAEVAVIPSLPENRSQHTFSHIFAGGYSAGYYSYKWAEVLSADAFSAFEEAGLFDATTGQRWQREVLAVGGSRPAMDSFRAFRGREPVIDALLRHQGMA